MLETIKAKLYEQYKVDDKIGLFFSLFDDKNILLASNGVISTDKPLEVLINLLYHGIVEKYPKCNHILIEIPWNIALQEDAKTLFNFSVAEYGICLVSPDDKKSGVLLPGTPGVFDMKTALSLVQKKFGLSGNVQIYTFTTDKISI